MVALGLAACGGGAAGSDGGGEPDPDAAPLPTPTVCSAATPCWYVTPEGAGAADGSSWANAFAGLPTSGDHEYLDLPIAAPTRGGTYLLADGDYPGYVWPAVDGDAPIVLRKATTADHGDAAGFDPSMGDGEAVFTGASSVFVFSPGAAHYVFDGQRGQGKAPGAFGFRLLSTAPRADGAYTIALDTTGTFDDVGDVVDITIEHVEFDGDNGTPAGPCASSAGMQVNGPRPNLAWRVRDSYFHHFSGGAAYLRSGADMRFERNYFERMGDETNSGDCPASGDHAHWETFWVTIDDGFALVGNTFENAYAPGQTGWVMMSTSDALIEDNLFFCSEASQCAVGGNGVLGGWSGDPNTNLLITGNTFRDFFNGAHFLFETGTNIVITGNTYINAGGLADP